MTVVVVPASHFSGQRAIEKQPGGDDTRDLRGVLNEAIVQANTNETNIGTNVTDIGTNAADIVTNAAAIVALGTPFDYKGSIAAAGDFPTAVLVEDGWAYLITADVIDNDGTKTNTGDAFKDGDEVVWNGTDWTRLGRKVTQLKAGDSQAVAATATTVQFMATRAGKITGVAAKSGATASGTEDMSVDVEINGTTCLTGPVVLDAAATTVLQVGTVDTAADDFVAGDLIQIVRTYTAGTPTPITDTNVTIDYEEILAT